jgi:hypothetical protein
MTFAQIKPVQYALGFLVMLPEATQYLGGFSISHLIHPSNDRQK